MRPHAVPRRYLLAAAVAAAACVLTSTAASAAVRRRPVVNPPTFAVFEAPSPLGDRNAAGEPSIGVDWRTGAVLYQANLQTFRVDFAGADPATSAAWSVVTPTQTAFNIDPILATDPASGLTFAGGDDGACSVLGVTDDDGANWQTSVPCTGTPDHPTVGVGPVASASLPVPGQHGRAVYFCQQYPLEDECTASLDDGTSWFPAAPVTGGCIGPSGHVKVSADGTAYLPIRACSVNNNALSLDGSEVGGAVSTDTGRSWTSYFIANAAWPVRGFDPSVATTPDNTVYESWAGYGSYHPLVAWSHDRGRSWSHPVDLAGTVQPPIAASTFQAAVGGDNGRVAIAFLGSAVQPTGTQTPFDPAYAGIWYLYVSFTYDGGVTWTTVRADPHPVQLGTICDKGSQCLNGRNLLDFMDATVDAHGRVLVGFAEGCRGGCPDGTNGSPQSQDSWAAVARQESGPPLFFRPRD